MIGRERERESGREGEPIFFRKVLEGNNFVLRN